MNSPICAAFLAALAVAGCSGGGATVTGGSAPCPVAGVFDPNAKLVSPAPGATGVPVTVGALSFTVSNPALRSGTVTLWIAVGSGNAPVVQGGSITTDANGVSTASLPVLQRHTTYDARIHATPIGPSGTCLGAVDGDLGSFTTQ